MKIKSRHMILNPAIKYVFVSTAVVASLIVWVMHVFFSAYSAVVMEAKLKHQRKEVFLCKKTSLHFHTIRAIEVQPLLCMK